MTDIVYILGKGSRWQNNEIRYSLRSVEKHLQGFRDVYIIGELPEFLKDVRHISLEDTHWCKETNIYNKVLRACQEPSISDQFLFFNDDHFLKQDYIASEIPYYYKGDLFGVVKRLRQTNKYGRCCKRTMVTLTALQLPIKMFDVHTPIIYDKKKFIDVMTRYDWGYKLGFVAKSLYCNSLNIEGEREPDSKINRKLTEEQIRAYIEPRKIWSIGNEALGEPLEKVMNELYPKPSRWEKI